MAEAKTKAGALLDLLGSLTADDLLSIDATIAACEAELEGLNAARKLVTKRLGLMPKRKPPTPKAVVPAPAVNGEKIDGRSLGVLERRRAIAIRISTAGPQSMGALCAQFKTSYGVIDNTIDCDWFDKESDGVHLTSTGRQALS